MNADPSSPVAGGVPARRILGHLYEAGRLIQKLDEQEDLLAHVLDGALQILGAQRGMILLRNETGEIVPAAVREIEDDLVADASDYSHTAVQEALAGKPVVALDVASDSRLSGLRSVSLYDIQSLICVPLRVPPDSVLGVLYIDSCRRGTPFQDDDLRFLTAFAGQAALAMESRRLYRRLRRENRRLTGQARHRTRYEGLLGHSEAMQQVYDVLDRAAGSPFPAILLGETGTGKELAARALHRRGSRSRQPFLAVNCASLTETLLESEMFGHVRGAFTGADTARKGLFELAHGGTLFLDEIGGMSPGMQAKLLRVLQEGEFRPVGGKRTRRVDVRVLGSTHQDLDTMVHAGSFREDLFYRLNVIRVVMPPLRERREDIPRLVEAFIARAVGDGGVKAPQIGEAAMREMTSHSWPGNVRELEHTVQKLVLYAAGGLVSAALVRRLLPRGSSKVDDRAGSGFPSLREVESCEVRRALTLCGGDREEAARRLGIGRATIYRKIKEYGLAVPGRS
ncbi:MAG: sigma 54-interacting transcriptional regulator [Acidobacteriota bacterium]